MSDAHEVVKRYEKWDSLFKGTFEIHIFVEPLDAPQEILDKFREVCNANKMKALFLVLGTLASLSHHHQEEIKIKSQINK